MPGILGDEHATLRADFLLIDQEEVGFYCLCTSKRLLATAAELDYPRDRLEIQLLDDSTDATRRVAARAIARLRRQGVHVVHITRSDRTGFKAGALAAGLAKAKGELITIFDADFLPPADFLRRVVPHFAGSHREFLSQLGAGRRPLADGRCGGTTVDVHDSPGRRRFD